MSKPSKLYRPGKAPTRQDRTGFHVAACVYRLRHDQLPGGGYIVFYHGKPCGWTPGVEGRPNGWLEGCVAVPADREDEIYVAMGGSALDGADHWEIIAR